MARNCDRAKLVIQLKSAVTYVNNNKMRLRPNRDKDEIEHENEREGER